MEKAETQETPESGREMQEMLLEGFSRYYEGLLCLRDYFQGGVDELILDAFELIYRGDVALSKVEDDIDKNDKNDIFSVIV